MTRIPFFTFAIAIGVAQAATAQSFDLVSPLPPPAPTVPAAPAVPVAPFTDAPFAWAAQVPPAPPAPPAAPRGPLGQRFTQGEGLYDQARNLIEREQYDRALPVLDRVIETRGTRVDAALYWKAYALSKLARRPEALTVLGDLQKQFPNGPWVKDAKALDVELRQASGQSVSADAADDDLKVLALRGLMQSDPEQAVPQIEKLLAGNSSVHVKDRALFVLGQSRTPRARAVLRNVAKTGSNPDLRLAAVRYLGMRNDPDSQQALEEAYRSATDRDMKEAVIRAFLMTGAADRLAQVARTEKDPELQASAIRTLGMTNRPEAIEALRSMYQSDASKDVKKTVIDALSMQRGASAALVDLARREKDPELKREMVQRLSMMRTPEAQQYMLEILGEKP